VGQQPEGVLALDDREHLEPAADPGQVGGDGVAGLVGGHHLLLQRGVGDRDSSSRCSIITGV
jgi:hypothetical protein